MRNVLIAILAVVVAAFLGFAAGRFTGAIAAKHRFDAETQRAFNKALQEKNEAEKAEREANRKLGDEYERAKTAIASRAAVVDTRLLVTVCPKSANVPQATASGSAPNATSGTERSQARVVDLGPIAGRIVELGADLDNCAAKVAELQAGLPGYTVGNE